MSDTFVREVLGDRGYSAVQSAVARLSDLAPLVPTQTIRSWVDAVARSAHIGQIPTTTASYALVKSESGYSGQVGGQTFSNRDLGAVVGLVAEIVGVPVDDRTSIDLAKTLDLIVKVELLKTAKPKVDAPGGHGPFLGQTKPMQPTMQPRQQKPKALKIPKVVKAPAQKETAPRPVTATLKLSEVQTCSACGGNRIEGQKLVGCGCLSGLLSKTFVKSLPDGYRVFFSHQWSDKDISLLVGIDI